ncbi:MAG TPA: GWxTD domain-containing protein [bacterium]|nr:GWxTD domain-containing protein [bacterium]
MNVACALARGSAIALGAAAIVFPLAPAQSMENFPIQAQERPHFVLDAISTPLGKDSSRVEILWEIPRNELAFRGEGEECRAQYDISIVFYQGKRQAAGDVWKRRIRCQDIPAGPEAKASGRESFTLARGEYNVEVTLTMGTTMHTSTVRGRLKLQEMPQGIDSSDLEFVWIKDGVAQPNPRHEIARGETGHFARIVLHSGTPRKGLLKWAISDGRRAVVASAESTLAFSGERIVDIALPMENLEPGSYRLEVTIADENGETLARRRADLNVRITMAWLASNRREAILLLGILGASDEADAVKKAGGEEWQKILQDYWVQNDPTPGTDPNEYQQETFARMEEANSAFEEPFRKPGWTTDRGRIFLLHGRPENRIVREADFNGPPAEIWEYFHPRRTFFFVDPREIGEYVLSSGGR